MSTAPANSLDAYWMPFTANRQFKANPRMLAGAEGIHYITTDGRRVIDGIAGLWCCAAGHKRASIGEAIARQFDELDYSPAFQMGHPRAFELAARLAALMPGDLNHVFFGNSGSEAVETALKIALAYHRVRGEGQRTRLIGREKGYHGVNFGGTSVGGMVANRKMFGTLLAGVDHLPHTHGLPENRFTRGQPDHGAFLANELERLCQLHDPSTIAAVIVEPVAGSGGVLLPPRGYLERLREICTRHGILLIFDEVITGFGRLGTPFAVDFFGVEPDLVTTAKALTNGVVPMGAVFAQKAIHDAFMQGPDNAIELFHGYTFSASPLACAAALASLDLYRDEGLLTRAADLAGHWEDGLHALRGLPHVIDIRNLGLIGAVELEPIAGQPTKRAFTAFLRAFEKGLLIRTTGDTIALCPPLIIEREQIDEMLAILADVIAGLE